MKSRVVLSVLIFSFLGLWLPVVAEERETTRSNVSYTTVEELFGKDVHGPDTVRAGIVADVFIDPEGKDVYFVLVRGSAFGVIGPYYPIPWQMADPRLRDGLVYIAFTSDIIEDAPGISVGDWPVEELSPEFAAEVREYYGNL